MWPQHHSSWVSGIRGGGKDHCFASAGGPRPAVETARPEATRRMGWPVTRVRQAHPSLGFLVRKGGGGHKVSRDPSATYSPAHPGLVSGSLGTPSLALPLLCWSPRSGAGRMRGEVSDARLSGSLTVVVGQPCGRSGCPKLSPTGTCCPPQLAHPWSQEEFIWGETVLGATWIQHLLAKQTPVPPPTSGQSQKVAAAELQKRTSPGSTLLKLPCKEVPPGRPDGKPGSEQLGNFSFKIV